MLLGVKYEQFSHCSAANDFLKKNKKLEENVKKAVGANREVCLMSEKTEEDKFNEKFIKFSFVVGDEEKNYLPSQIVGIILNRMK